MKTCCLIFVAIVFALASGWHAVVCHGDEFDLSSDHGFTKTLAEIRKDNVQELRAIRQKLEERDKSIASIERRALFLGYVAERFFEIDQTDEGMRTLEFVMNMPLPDDHHEANVFSMWWKSAASYWSEEMFRQEKSAAMLERLQSYPPDRGCFAQKIAQSSLLQSWTRTCISEKAAIDLASSEFSRLANQFPKRAHYIALRDYVDFVAQARAVDADRRIAELNRIRAATTSSLEETSDLESAMELLKVLRNANTALARILVRKPERSAMIGQLSDELGSMARVFNQLLSRDHPNYAKNLEFSARQQQGFDSYVAKHAEYVRSLSRPRIFESELLGRPCPEIGGQVIREETPFRKIEPDDVVLLDFWSTTCGPCIKSFPKLIDLYKQHQGSGFRIVGIAPLTHGRWSDKENRLAGGGNISRAERVRAMSRFVEILGLPWQQVIDSDDRKIMDSFDVSSYPTYVVVGRDGVVKLVAGGGEETFVEIAKCIRTELAVPRKTPDLKGDEP